MQLRKTLPDEMRITLAGRLTKLSAPVTADEDADMGDDDDDDDDDDAGPAAASASSGSGRSSKRGRRGRDDDLSGLVEAVGALKLAAVIVPRTH